MKYLHIVLSLGLSVLIAKIPPRFRYLLLAVVILNEIRGILFAFEGFKLLWKAT